MKSAKLIFALPLALIALGWILSQMGQSTAADPAPKDTGPPPAVIDASAYPTLQAAFDAVPISGGLVRLPPGHFRLTEPLILERPDTRVEGAGAATRLINCNREGKPALIVRPPNLDANPRAFVWRVQLANFRICGDPDVIDAKSTEPTGGDGLLAQRVNEIYIEGLSVDHNGGHGVNLVDCLEDARVSNSIFTYNRQAGLNILGAHDIIVNANQFEENQDAVRCIKVCNLCMNGNNLDDHLRHGVVIETTYGSVLSGNMIEECQGTAVILDADCHGITISANVIAHNFQGGLDLRDAWGCTVSANTLPVTAIRRQGAFAETACWYMPVNTLPEMQTSAVPSSTTPWEASSRMFSSPMWALQNVLPVMAIRPAWGPTRTPNGLHIVSVLAETVHPQASRRSTPPLKSWAITLALIVLP
jgi:hypothetical protein